MNGMMSSGYYERKPLPARLQKSPGPGNYGHGYADDDLLSNDGKAEEYHGSGPSINGIESLEHLVPNSDPSSQMQSQMQSLALNEHRAFRDDDFNQVVERVWDEMGNKALPLHESQLMLRQLEKRADAPIRRTYIDGQLCADGVIEGAVVIKVGILFLPGSDKAEVNRLEQFDMTGKEPDQQDAMWRVNTAASLLSVFDVDNQLSVVQRDQTAKIAEKARTRRSARRDSGVSGNSSSVVKREERYRSYHDAVTIDSAEVKMTTHLNSDEWDISSTLIEVDGTSLWGLIVHYRQLILTAGPDPPFEVTRDLLETMIEDARRLWVRSPILFRMSTRAKIINSKNTRYGVNTPDGFTTYTTSKGIQETISQSAAYFNSLDPTNRGDKTQAFIRPRFLQMVVLLLSLLNEEDLLEISEFLETTYGLRAERQHLELLFLKVIPLMSINPKVFLKAIVPAVEGRPLNEPVNEENYSYIWSVFVSHRLQQGYLLPGNVDDLGSLKQSWISKWPRVGIKNSMVFHNLQYQGGGPTLHSRTFNDIPPIEIRPEYNCSETKVILTDGSEYMIESRDLEQITCMVKGIYSVQEAKENGRRHDLVVEESLLNESIVEATKMINIVIRRANRWLTGQKKPAAIMARKFRRVVSGRQATSAVKVMNELAMVPRLTRHVAYLNQSLLAITYKTDGRRITKQGATRELSSHRSLIAGIVQHYMSGLDTLDFQSGSDEVKLIKEDLDRVVLSLNQAERVRASIHESEKLADEPVAKVDFPGGLGPTDTSTWNDYQAWSAQNLLHIESKRTRVKTVAWKTADLVDVYLDGSLLKYTVRTLKEVNHIGREDEIQVDDVVLLVGYYMVVAEELESPSGSAYSMTNYLRIVGIEEKEVSRRGQNRKQQQTTMETIFV